MLIVEYEAMLREILAGLDAANHQAAVDLAKLPEQIRGFGHVKRQHLERVRARERELIDRFRNPPRPATPRIEVAVGGMT